jgi:hypothetical protein
MKRIFTTLALILSIFSQTFAKDFSVDSLIRIKPDTIVKPERDSVIAPPEGWQNQKIGNKNNPLYPNAPNINNAPSLVFPVNYSSINGTSVSLYWNKNNSLGICDYLVRVVDLTTLTSLYNYTNAGDNSSFSVQNLIAGHNYTVSIKAVSKNDGNDFAESTVYNISVPSSNVATLGLTSITTNTFCGSNRTLTINYSRSGSFNNNQISTSTNSYFGNTFVELSDKNGSFVNPILIGGTSLSSSSGSFSISLPSNLVYGTNYKIRLFSYSPVAMSGESVAMTIGTVADPDIWNKFNSSIRYNSINLCTGSTATIKTALADTTSIVFQWKKDGVNVTSGGIYSKYVVTTGGNYTLSVTQGTCPTVTSGQTYVYNFTGSTTTYLNRSGDIIQCTGGSAILSIPYWSDNQTYQWQKNGQTISGANQRTYTANQTGTYSTRITDGSCSITAISDALTFGSSISLVTTLGSSTICSTGGQTYVSVSPSYSPNLSNYYQWKRNGQNISGATSDYYTSLTQAGVYTVEVTQGGCTATSQGMEVKTSTTLDSVKIIKEINSFCSSSSINLRPSNSGLINAIYNWVKSGVTLSLSSNYYATTNGDYSLTVAQGSCVTTSQPVNVNLANDKYIPILYLSGNNSSVMKDTVFICPNTVPLYINNYPSNSTFEWYKDGVIISNATSYNYSPSQGGNYSVKITSGTCVLNTKSVFVATTLPKFTLNAIPQNPNVCANNIVKLDFLNKGVYPYYCAIWKKDGITLNTCGSYSFNALESGIYTVAVQQGSCFTESEPVNIKMGEATTASISGNTTIASGGTAKVYVTFTGSAPWTFTLSDGNNITTSNNPYTHNVTPTISTTYTLTSIIGSCGAGTVSGSGVVTIGACATPTAITTQPLAQTKCTGSSVTFSTMATSGGILTYQWKKDGQNINGATNSSYVISNLKTADMGNYSIEVTGTCGTTLSNNALLKPVNDVPVFASATNPVYSGSALRLSASSYANNVTYTWQGPNGYASNLQNPIIPSAVGSNGGVYTISVSNGQGCVGQAVASTNVLVANIVLVNLSNTTFCAGGAGTLSFSPTTGGGLSHYYAVQISDSNGSFGSSPTIIGTSQTSPITFSVPSGYSSGTTSTYVLRVVDLDDIANVSSPSAVIYFNGLTVSLETPAGKNGNILICPGSSLKLLAKLNQTDNNDVTYEWKKDGMVIGVTSATYTTNQLGTYQVKATKTGCGVSNLSSFSISSFPDVFIAFYQEPSSYQCAGSTISLKSYYEAENATYEWRRNNVVVSGQTGTILNMNQSGLYELKVTDINCSSVSRSISKTFTFSNTIPSRIYTDSYGKDTAVTCSNYSQYMYHEAGSSVKENYTYQWRRDGIDIPFATNYSLSPSSSGAYTLKIIQGNCTTTSPVINLKVTGTASKIITAPFGTTVCSGRSVYMYVEGLTCASYQWQKDGVDLVGTNSTYTTYYATQTGMYRVKVIENGIVSYSNVISVTITDNPNYILRKNYPTVTNCNTIESYQIYNSNSGDSYEWYRNNNVIPSVNNSYYVINTPGTYKVKVTNGSCIGYSQDVIVNATNQISKPIIFPPDGKILCGNSYTRLDCTIYPTGIYEWRRNGQLISNSTNFFVDATQSGIYTITMVQGSCSATSDPLVINIGDKQQSIKTFNWNDASTWSCGTVPVVTEDILINKGHTVTIPNNYTGFMKDLQLNGALNYGTNALLKSRTN